MSAKSKYHIGCSGYYYSYWKNRFYPEGLQPKDWLLYYSSIFNSVELNGTFYRMPKLADLKRYAEVTRSDFDFSVKMNRYITHIMKLKDCGQQVSDFTSLIEEGLGKKLSCFLFQFPPSFVYNEENLQRLLHSVGHDERSIVEFRHPSWWNKTVADELKKAKITFCNIDHPKLETYMIHTTNTFYFRFHGNPILFKSLYSEEQLDKVWKDIPGDCINRYVYFNNTYYEAGYTNALQLKKIIGEEQ